MMKQLFGVLILGFMLSGCATKVVYFSLQDALNDPNAKDVLGQDIKVDFGKKANVSGTIITTSKRTTLAGKGSVEKACRWVLYSAIKQFQKAARNDGGNRVVNIIGNWKGKAYDSVDTFQCAVGNMLAGIALKGEIIK